MVKNWTLSVLLHATAIALTFGIVAPIQIDSVEEPKVLDAELPQANTVIESVAEKTTDDPEPKQTGRVKETPVSRILDQASPIPNEPKVEVHPSVLPTTLESVSLPRPRANQHRIVKPIRAPAASSEPTADTPRPSTKPAQSTPKSTALPKPDRAPVLLPLDWPRSILRKGKATVLAEIVISHLGKPESVSIIEGSGDPDFDAMVHDALKDARFVPGSVRGVPVTCRHNFRFKFAPQK